MIGFSCRLFVAFCAALLLLAMAPAVTVIAQSGSQQPTQSIADQIDFQVGSTTDSDLPDSIFDPANQGSITTNSLNANSQDGPTAGDEISRELQRHPFGHDFPLRPGMQAIIERWAEVPNSVNARILAMYVRPLKI